MSHSIPIILSSRPDYKLKKEKTCNQLNSFQLYAFQYRYENISLHDKISSWVATALVSFMEKKIFFFKPGRTRYPMCFNLLEKGKRCRQPKSLIYYYCCCYFFLKYEDNLFVFYLTWLIFETHIHTYRSVKAEKRNNKNLG